MDFVYLPAVIVFIAGTAIAAIGLSVLALAVHTVCDAAERDSDYDMFVARCPGCGRALSTETISDAFFQEAERVGSLRRKS